MHLSYVQSGIKFLWTLNFTYSVEFVSVPSMDLEGMAKISILLVGLWLLVNWSGLLDAKNMKYKNPKHSTDTRVEDLVSRMTLEEKIGQMLQIERKYASADLLKKYFIGNHQTLFLVFFFPLLFVVCSLNWLKMELICLLSRGCIE